jgi:hypothetical protein
MRFEDLPFEVEVVTAELKRLGEDRLVGLHLSDIVRFAMKEAGRNLDLPNEQKGVRAYAGFLWEEALEWAFKRAMGFTRPVQRQIRTELDGILMSPDGVDVEFNRLEEYKFTWKSHRSFVEQSEFELTYWNWLMQIKAYCLSLGTCECDLFAFFARGDYGADGGPKVVRRRLVFEDDELLRNWANVLKIRDMMAKEAA